MKTALITGISGQDGAYLAKFLLDKGYEVFGTYRRLSTPNFWRLQYLDIFESVNLIPADFVDAGSMVEAVKISEPDDIYHLALEAIRQLSPEIKFYQASTSELYGRGHSSCLTEDSLFQPASPYSAAKLYGYWLTRQYREGYNIFACNGILFNHESPLGGLEFVTRKISNAVAKIALGIEKELYLGNLGAKREWGYAPDYIESMWLMLQQKEPDEYVVATDEAHSIKEFTEKAFEIAGLDGQEYVKVDKRFLRPLDVNFLQGDYSKAKKKLGWACKDNDEGGFVQMGEMAKWRTIPVGCA